MLGRLYLSVKNVEVKPFISLCTASDFMKKKPKTLRFVERNISKLKFSCGYYGHTVWFILNNMPARDAYNHHRKFR